VPVALHSGLREPLIKSVFLHTVKTKGRRTGFAAKKGSGLVVLPEKSAKRHRCCGMSRPLLLILCVYLEPAGSSPAGLRSKVLFPMPALPTQRRRPAPRAVRLHSIATYSRRRISARAIHLWLFSCFLTCHTIIQRTPAITK
jgi:hypothetical protein